MRSVRILLFDDVELLDFSGPYEVLWSASMLSEQQLFGIRTMGWPQKDLRAKQGLLFSADEILSSNQDCDVLIIPGGSGVREIMNDDEALNTIRELAGKAQKVISVCTGSLILAKAGLLSGQKATTHHENYQELQSLDPEIQVLKQRYADNGKILCAEGVSAGIDASLFYIQQIAGEELANKTADYMMYRQEWNSSRPAL